MIRTTLSYIGIRVDERDVHLHLHQHVFAFNGVQAEHPTAIAFLRQTMHRTDSGVIRVLNMLRTPYTETLPHQAWFHSSE
jgi:hypothetical protein